MNLKYLKGREPRGKLRSWAILAFKAAGIPGRYMADFEKFAQRPEAVVKTFNPYHKSLADCKSP